MALGCYSLVTASYGQYSPHRVATGRTEYATKAVKIYLAVR